MIKEFYVPYGSAGDAADSLIDNREWFECTPMPIRDVFRFTVKDETWAKYTGDLAHCFDVKTSPDFFDADVEEMI